MPPRSGGNLTCTASYTTTQADVDAGKIDNTATITATDPAGNPTTGTDDATTDSTGTSSISLAKTVSATSYALGDELTYTFVITNSGTLTLHGVSLTEDSFTGSGTLSALDCDADLSVDLAPGDSVTCTATYTATQADVDATRIDNSATATGTDPTGKQVSQGDDAASLTTGTPGVTLEKQVSAASYAVGDELTYTFVITNIGSMTLRNLGLTEDAFTGSGQLGVPSCDQSLSTLAPAGVIRCTASYTVTQADVDAGQIDNTASVHGTTAQGSPVDDTDDATSTSTGSSALEFSKTVSSLTYDLGDTLTYTFKIENTGTLTLHDLGLVEDSFSGTGTMSALDCDADLTDDLAPGASITCTATYVTTQADVDAGRIDNSATATGTDPTGAALPRTDTATTTSNGTSGIELSKAVDATEYGVGDTLTYTFTITNTGTLTLRGITLDDSNFSGTGTLSALNCGTGDLNADLAPGAVLTCTASYVATQADVDAGQIDNSASVTATGVTGGHPTGDTDDATSTSKGISDIELTKSVSATEYGVGDTLTYTFTITNTGTLTLRGITLDDSNFSGTGTLSALDCAGADLAADLAPGATITCTASYVTTQADVDAGQIDNSASVTATGVTGGHPTDDTDDATTKSTGTTGIAVEKTVNATTYGLGDTLTYTFVIRNTGTLTLTGVTLSETSFTGSGTPSAIDCGGADLSANLAPQATITCTATYVTTQADVDAGSITNVAEVSGTDLSGTNPAQGSDDASSASNGNAAVTLDKSVDKTSYSLGEELTYTFVITNTGTVTLSGLDLTEDAFSGTGALSAIGCGTQDLADDLAPGASITCTATYTATQADVDAGSIENLARITGTGINGTVPATSTDGASTTSTGKTAISLQKTVDKAKYSAGELLTYTFVVTNTGTTTLNSLNLSETSFTGTGLLSAIDCGAGIPTSLAPGASFTCTATYQVTDDDIDLGSISNTASATGTGMGGVPVDGTGTAKSKAKTATGGVEDGEGDHVGANTGLPGGGALNWPLIALGSLLAFSAMGIAVIFWLRRKREHEADAE